MLTTTIALIVMAQAPIQDGQAAQQSPAQLISKMLKHYSDAKSLTGTIKLSQGIGKPATGSMVTAIQFEKPSMLYIRQTLKTSEPREWVITSDGERFSYPKPEYLPGDPRIRLIDKVTPRPGEVLDIRGIYSVCGQSLGDRPVPLDVAIGRPQDLKTFTQQLVTLEPRGKTKLGEEEVNLIEGRWRDYTLAEGRYAIYVTDAGDFRRYVVVQMVKPSARMDAVEVTSQWDINLVVNGKTDPNLFTLIK